MKKQFHIIPGWEDSCNDSQYQSLAEEVRGAGYEAVFHEVNWKQPLSQQITPVPESAVIFGFSLGAILAWLIAEKHACHHLILASMTPHYSFTDPEIKKALIELTGQEFVDDIITHLTDRNHAEKQTILYGALEDEPGDVLVPETEHELTKNYIKAVVDLLEK